MPVLGWIVLAATAGGVLSILAAYAFAATARPDWVPRLVSFAIGALLGAAFLEIIPHSIERSGDPGQTAAMILAGILLFFVLEKLVLWRHCHDDHCEAHGEHGQGERSRSASGALILIGDTFHNFVDGVLIAAAFMQDITLGVVSSLAVIAHEIPQEVGDFFVLLHSGYSRREALLFNLASSLATLVGGGLAYFAFAGMDTMTNALLGLAAASMIYVAVADLIPGLHRRLSLQATIEQVVLIALGIASISFTHQLAERLVG